MAISGPKSQVNPFGKMSIFQLFKRLVFLAQKGVFFVLECHKRHSPGPYCLKKKIGKLVIFGLKPLVNPFGKMSIFRLFESLVFIAQKGVFFFLEYHKRHFPGIYCLKKKLEKWRFLDQNHGLTQLEKWQFFDLFELLVFIAQKGVFSFQNIIKDIFLAYIA